MTSTIEPETTLDPRFSSPGVPPVAWADALATLAAADLFWLSTVRPDGRPHVTPVIAAWVDGALYVCTGPTERKARNLEQNRQVALTTGCNSLAEGMDLVVEGVAEHVTDAATLSAAAAAYRAKYGDAFAFSVRDESLWSDEGGAALLFAIRPVQAFGFGKGDAFSQTRWRFQ